MLTLNETDYRLCLLDTNALSEMGKNRTALENFLTWSLASEPIFIPCFSVFSLVELRRSAVAYRGFVEVFGAVPCMALKNHEQLLVDEVHCYPDPSGVDPCLAAFTPLGGEATDLAKMLNLASGDEIFLASERYWLDARAGVVEDIASLVDNFPPEGKKYTREETRVFMEIAAFSQLAMHQRPFAERVVGANQAVDMGAFPSLKSTTYSVWHKFYADRDRRPSDSDAFDIIISAVIPYVDAIVTENHQAEALRKTKRLDDFIESVDVLTLKDLRHPSPVRAA